MQAAMYLERVLPMYKEVWAKEQKIREKEASEELPRRSSSRETQQESAAPRKGQYA